MLGGSLALWLAAKSQKSRGRVQSLPVNSEAPICCPLLDDQGTRTGMGPVIVYLRQGKPLWSRHAAVP